jgi:hypothetical protein
VVLCRVLLLNRYDPHDQPLGGSRTRAIVSGRVVRVRARRNGGWRIRLADTGGALAAGEIRMSNPLPLPPVGACILLCGAIRYDREHGWYAIDPVEQWVEPHGY